MATTHSSAAIPPASSNDNDCLIGSRGVDVLTGGPGADRFIFGNNETGVGAKRDRITDLNQFEGDKIDLSLIDANIFKAGKQKLVWDGWNKKVAKAGKVVAFVSGGKTIIRGNQNSNGTSTTFEIQLNTLPQFGSLSASDFIF